MHKANDASCPRSFETNVSMYDSEFRPSRVVSFRTVATQKTSPTNRTLFRATRPIVTPSGVDAPRDVNWTTSPSIAKATRSFTRATETIARPSREFKRFKSRSIGPTRMPASPSPIIGDWWSFSIASPAARAVTKMISRPRIRSTGPHYLGTQSTKPAAIYSFLRGYPHCEPRMTLKDKLRVGCSGWGSDDWLGWVYSPGTPQSEYLKLYSGGFYCVEVGSSVHRQPGAALTKRWDQATTAG